MDYRRSDSYYRRGRSPPRSRYRKSRSRERSHSPERRRWSRDRRGHSPERYSSSWRVESPRRRSRSRSYGRSRSRSNSRGRYSSRRSRSHDSYGRRRRDSSSPRDKRSNSRGGRTQHLDEAHNAIYSEEEQESQSDSHSFPFQSGNKPNSSKDPESAQEPGVTETAAFAALKQGYDRSDTDDEERYLYGEDSNEGSKPPPSKKVGEVKSESKDSTVTPGGFDSNALKNVLKAIGFDFEMSQQIQSSMAKSKEKKVEGAPIPTPPPKKTIPKEPPKAPKPKAEVPQKIQTIQSTHGAKGKRSENTSQEFFSGYDPYNRTTNNQFNAPHIQPTSQVAPQMVYPGSSTAPLGYHTVAIPDPNNPGGTLLVYQPLNQPITQQTVYHQQEQNIVHGGRVVLPPQRSEDTSVTTPEKDERQERLNYLQEELEKLKKQQNQLMEKKKKDNARSDNKSQTGSDGLKNIRQAAEQAAGIVSDSSDDSAKEHKAIDPYDRPWDDREKTKKSKSAHLKTKSLKGAEFLIPVTGYFCTICHTFSGDQICADEHLKSHSHNDIYRKHCKKNPSYEKKYKKKKKAALEEATGETRNGDTEDDIKAKTKSKSEKEEKWVEKVPKAEPANVDSSPIYPEFKPYATDKTSYDFSGKVQPRNKTPPRPSRNMEQERHQRHRPDNDRNDLRQDKIEQKQRSKWDYPEPRHDDSHHKKEKERVEKVDHGKRTRSWSPGYDEYERQQQIREDQNNRHEEYGKGDHDRSTGWDHSERWTDKPDPPRQKDYYGKQSDSTKKMPGFGKFTWSSGTVRSNRRLEPAPGSNAPCGAFNQPNEEVDGKGKIAIKITGKTQYPARLSNVKSCSSKPDPTDSEKKAVMDDLKKKVEALKRENALRNQLSSITLPVKRSGAHPRPNTAAVMLGTRNIGKHNTLLHAKMLKSAKDRKLSAESRFQEIEADVSPPPPPTEIRVKPPPPREYEPPPPGEEDMDLGIDDEDARSDASGISMELGSDEG